MLINGTGKGRFNLRDNTCYDQEESGSSWIIIDQLDDVPRKVIQGKSFRPLRITPSVNVLCALLGGSPARVRTTQHRDLRKTHLLQPLITYLIPNDEDSKPL